MEGIVTLARLAHIANFDEAMKVREQIAFAVFCKQALDLVENQALDVLEDSLKDMNPMAKWSQTEQANAPLNLDQSDYL